MKAVFALPLAALLAATPASAQHDNPGVFISPPTGTYTERSQSVLITWSHEYDLVSTSRVITFNNADVTGSFTYQPQTTGSVAGAGARAVSTGTVTLADGANTLTAYICGSGSGCTTDEVVLTYEPAPPPAQRTSPVVSLAPYHSGYANPARYGSMLSYTTPSYVSLDRERSVTMYYSSELASPRPLIQFNVTDHSLEPAQRFEVRVLNGGAALPLSNGSTVAVFSNQGGTTGGTARLGVELDPSAAAGNAAYNYTLQVTSVWSSGTQPAATTRAVRVPVVHRGGSQYGAGWGVLGLQSILVQADGLLVDEGDGSARFFAGTGPTYTRPDGDFSTITRTSSGTFQRTWPDGGGAWFDGTGRLSYTYSAAGDTTIYEYAAGPLLGRIVDPAGQAIVFDYHPGYYLAGITVPGKRRTQFWYSGTDISEIVEPDGTRALQQLSHSAGHRLDSWVDRAGGQWNVTYGPQRAVTITGPQITASGAQQRPATTVRTEKRLLAPAPGQGTTASPLPRLTADSVYATVTDPRGFTTRAWLDRYGQPLKVVGPLGHSTTIERNPHGQPVRITGSGGTATDLDWNTDGTIARSFDESRGLQVDYGYQTLNGSTFLRRTSEGVMNTEYDRGTRGEILRARVGTDTVARYTYDARLRVKTVTDRAGHVVEYFYDGTAWKNADSVRFNTSAGIQRSAFTYDAAGRTWTATAPDGRVTTFTYDDLNRVLKQRAPGDSVRYAWNARGLWRVTDAAGKNFDFTRNVLGWVETEHDTNGRTTSYRYDVGGNVIGTTDRAGRVFAMRYDALGRVDSLSAPDATLRYGFDNPAGRWVWSERVGESRDTLYLDGAGHVHSAVSVMGGVRYEVQSTWRVDGQRSQVAVRGGPATSPLWQEVMNYGYDGRQRLEAMSDQSGYATSVTYDAEGLPATITWPNSAATLTLGYTPRHQIGSVSYSRSALNTGLGAGTLGYDILNRLESRTSTDGQRVTEYGYDIVGRLSARTESKLVYVPPPPFCDGNSTEPECDGYQDWASVRHHSYNYDAVGNRTGWTYSDSTGAALSYAASLQPASNRYAGFGGWTLSYDSVGNLVSRTNGSATVQYQWNSLGQLTGVSTPSSGWIYYGYNGFGMRVRRTTAAGATTRYVYDGGDLAAEVDANGNRVRTYTYWPGIDQPHSMRTWENGANGAVHYYALDLPSGSVRGLFNMSGALTHSYQYSPFGEPQRQSEGTHNPLRFAARELDVQTGMYYVRARWYDPFLGRFVSEDPIGLAGGINTYAYAGNDPVNFTDPTGLERECIVRGYHHFRRVGDGPWEYSGTEITYTYCTQDDDEMPHHHQFGTPELARKEIYGPWPLTPEERERMRCLDAGWFSPTSRQVMSTVRFMTGDMAGLYNDPGAQAMTVSDDMVVISGGPLGAMWNHRARQLAFIVGHELGHIVQRRSLGPTEFDQLWRTEENRMQTEADLYAVEHVSTSGPTCPIGK